MVYAADVGLAVLVPQVVPCQYQVSPAVGVIVFNVVETQAGLVAAEGVGGSRGAVQGASSVIL